VAPALGLKQLWVSTASLLRVLERFYGLQRFTQVRVHLHLRLTRTIHLSLSIYGALVAEVGAPECYAGTTTNTTSSVAAAVSITNWLGKGSVERMLPSG
jgi:hypothetical protein